MGVLAGDRSVFWVPVSPVVRVVTETDQWLVRADAWMRLPLDEQAPAPEEDPNGRLGFGVWRTWLEVLWVPSPWGDKLQVCPDPPVGWGRGVHSSPVVEVVGEWSPA